MAATEKTGTVIASVGREDGKFWVLVNCRGEELHAVAPQSYPMGKSVSEPRTTSSSWRKRATTWEAT